MLPRMSDWGHKRTLRIAVANSALSPKNEPPRKNGCPPWAISGHMQRKRACQHCPTATAKADSQKRFRFTSGSGHVRRKRGDSSAPTELSCARILLKITTRRERTGRDQTHAG